MKDLTVIVITYRRPEILRRTLEAYRRVDSGDLRWKLVLVDNAGEAHTRELAEEFGESLPLEFLVEGRRGQNFARNVGLEEAEGELYVFSDDDALPAPDWLTEIWSGVSRWPDATMFTGRILPIWPPGYEPLELRTDLLRSAYMVTAWGEDEGYIQPDRMWGPNLAIRAGPFREGHRFDTSIGPTAGQYAMGSELELAVRLSWIGHKGVYLPRAIVRHQIRPEQMEERWLVGRAYRSGRGVVRLQGVPPSPRILGVPRFVLRETATHGFEWFAGWLTRSGNRRLDGKLDFFHWQGKLREYWSVRLGAPVERLSGGTSDTVDGSYSPGPEYSPLPLESEDPSGPDLTVLIATYRRPEILRRTLEAYRRMDSGGIRWMLVLVDNAGDVRTEGLAREFAPELPLEYLVEPRRGKNFALNAGLRRARGGLLVFSDDDTVPEPDWLAEIWFGALRWPEATMFTGCVRPLWPDGSVPLDLRTDLIRSAFMVTDWGEQEAYVPPQRVRGANLAIRAAVFRDGIRFDTSIGPSAGHYAMGSEMEFTLRLSREGHRVVYLPGAIVHHQIRPEQMEESWLAGRAFRSGRGVARLQGLPSSPSVLGVPRFVFREVGTHAFEWLAGLVARDGHRRLDGKLGFFHWLGKLREYRRLRGRRAHEPSP